MVDRIDHRYPASVAVFTATATTQCTLTIPGETTNDIFLTHFTANYTGPGQQVNQQANILIGTTEIFRAGSTTGVDIAFWSPIRITRGNNLVMTLSATLNTIACAISATYYRE